MGKRVMTEKGHHIGNLGKNGVHPRRENPGYAYVYSRHVSLMKFITREQLFSTVVHIQTEGLFKVIHSHVSS